MTRVLLLASAFVVPAAAFSQPHARASVSRCLPANLSLRATDNVSPTTGAHPIALRLVNRGRDACTVSGYPNVVLRDGRGIIPFIYRHGGDTMVTSHPPRPVLLRRGGSAYVLLDKFRCDLGNRRVSTAVQVGLHGSTARGRPVAVANGIALCKPGIAAEGRVVNVSPFEPTLRATLHG